MQKEALFRMQCFLSAFCTIIRRMISDRVIWWHNTCFSLHKASASLCLWRFLIEHFGTKPYLQNVVAWGVAEVPHANLCAHVPPTEGAASELQAANLQQHVGDRWEAVPFQVQVLEPLIPGEKKQAGMAAGVLIHEAPYWGRQQHPLAICTVTYYYNLWMFFQSISKIWLKRSAAKININAKKPLRAGQSSQDLCLPPTTHSSHPLGVLITLLSAYYLQSRVYSHVIMRLWWWSRVCAKLLPELRTSWCTIRSKRCQF